MSRSTSADGRRLPIAPLAEPGRRRLPLAGPARAIDEQHRPIYAVWEITLRCDLGCHHCGSRAGRARPDELTTAEALDLIAQMRALGVTEVTLIGGEAYLRDDWIELVRAIVGAGMLCSITTGGRAFGAEHARAVAAAGIHAVSVSVDGLEDTHDALRGVKGSFRAAVDALGHLRAAGVRVHANTQICRPNLAEIGAVFDVVASAGARAWQVQLTAAMGRAADEPALLLEPYHVLQVHPVLADLARRGETIGCRLWPGNNIGYFGPHEHVLRGTFPLGHNGGCGAGRLLLGIEANGDVKGCPSLPSQAYVGGNIRDHSLVDIWERSQPLRFMRDRTVDDLWGFCRTCYYAEDCMAGCSWTTHVLLGRPGNNPYCHHRALQLHAEGKRERLIRVEEAPGVPFDHARFEIVVEDRSDAAASPAAPDGP